MIRGMKRAPFFLACMVLMGAVLGRVVLAPRPLVLGTGLFLALGCAGAGWFVLRRGTSAVRERGWCVRLGLAWFLCLAFWQQNETVRRERVAEAQVRALAGREVAWRGTVVPDPWWQSPEHDRVVVELREVEILENIQDRTPSSSTLSSLSSPPASVTPLLCRVQLAIQGQAAEALDDRLPWPGERLEVRSALNLPPPASHPDLFDYRAFLRQQGIGALSSVWTPNALRMENNREGERNFLLARLLHPLMAWRRGVLERFEQSLPPDRAGVMQCMLLGETNGLTPAVREAFLRVGGLHLFSVSGVHTAFLAMLVFWVCLLFLAPPRVSAWLMMAVLAVYVVLVEFRAPVVRSAVMAGCLALPFAMRRTVDSLNAISLGAFGTQLFDPCAVFRIDFQLSYLCALSLIVLYPALMEVLRLPAPTQPLSRWKRWARWGYDKIVTKGLSVSLASQLAVLPFLSIGYHQISLIGFVANLFLVPWSGLLIGFGWVFALVGGWSAGLEAILAAWVSSLTWVFLKMAEWLAKVPGGVLNLTSFPWWVAGGYYMLLFSGPHMRMGRFPGALEQRRARILVRLMVILAFLIWLPIVACFVAPYFTRPDSAKPVGGELQVTTLDVGQGDSILIETPGQHTLLVDAGPPNRGRTILGYLRAEGVTQLDALVLTHSDADHIGSAAEVLDGIPVECVYVGSDRGETQLQRELDTTIKRRGIPVQPVRRGDRLKADPAVEIEVLNPAQGSRDTSDANGQSVVLLIQYGQKKFLLEGDADTEAEREMLQAYGSRALDVDVLKAGHHGSQSSSSQAFLDALTPEVALISVAAKNRYHHPNPGVVERLRGEGATVYSTAQQGVLEVRTDGQRLWVRTGRGGMEN
jgi:competence protein ComEC